MVVSKVISWWSYETTFTMVFFVLYFPQEIYLQKSSTSQLGITLGYDTTTPEGRLYVCEVRTRLSWKEKTLPNYNCMLSV